MTTNNKSFTTICINIPTEENKSYDVGEIKIDNINTNIEGVLYSSSEEWSVFFRLNGDGTISVYEKPNLKELFKDELPPLEMENFLDVIGNHFKFSEMEKIKQSIMTALEIAANTPAAKTCTNGECRIKEITATENGNPIMVLDTPEGEYYLMDFRRYCVAINGSKDGSGSDYGSSRPIAFRELNTIPALAKAEYIRLAAAAVLSEFCKSQNFTMSIKTKFDWFPDKAFMEFVKAVFAFEFPDEKWPYII
jgi:hypothetical protein